MKKIINNYNVTKITCKSKFLHIEKDIIIARPLIFNESDSYDIYLVFDGHDMMLNDNNIFFNNNSNAVFIGLTSTNNMTRFNDLTTYTNDDVKIVMTKYFPVLAESSNKTLGGNGKNYLEFIINEVLPVVKKEFQVKIKTLNAVGCSLGAYFCLQMLYLAPLSFTKMLLLSPALWFNERIINDLQTKVLNNNCPLTTILWVGKKEPKFFEGKIVTNYETNTILLQKLLISKKITTKLIIDDNGSHGFKWWIKFLTNNNLF